MRLGAFVSAVALTTLVGASPGSAAVVDLHTLHNGNTFSGNSHSNASLSSSTITDTYDFRLSSLTGASSLTIFDGFLGFSNVTLELFSLSGSIATQLFPSVSGIDPLILSDSNLTNGQYELKVIDTLPAGHRIGRHEFIIPSSGSYVLDFDVHSTSLIDPPPTATAAVPEPSTWLMMIAGFLGLGLMAYRKKSTLRFA